jgi:hypothetical protein
MEARRRQLRAPVAIHYFERHKGAQQPVRDAGVAVE